MRRLRALKIDASGWDPVCAAHLPIREADVVTLTYVVNVIEQPEERVAVLRRAFGLAREVLVVTVRFEPGLRDVPAVRSTIAYA